jgi:hypothetical protein
MRERTVVLLRYNVVLASARHAQKHRSLTSKVESLQRAALHERVAAWLEETIGGGTAEHAERAGHHLEESYRYRAELGLRTDSDHDLAGRAAELLAIAGRRAFGRGDMPAAANLLWFHADVLMDLVEVLRLAGRSDEAAEAAREALALYERKGIVPYERGARTVLEGFRAEAAL